MISLTTSANIILMQISDIVITFFHSHTPGLDREVSMPHLVDLNLLLFCFLPALINTSCFSDMKDENCAFPKKQPIAIL